MLRRLTIWQRFLITTAVPLCYTLALIGVVTLVRMDGRSQSSVLEQSARVQAEAHALVGTLNEAEASVQGYVLTGSRANLTSATTATQAAPDAIRALGALVSEDPEDTPRFAAIAALAGRVMAANQEQIRLMKAGRRDQAMQVLRDALQRGDMQSMRSSVDDLVEVEQSEGEASIARLNAYRAAINILLAAGSIVAIAISVTATLLFGRSIINRLTIVTENAERFSRGQGLNPPQPGEDEIATLDAALHRMTEAIREANRTLEERNAQLESLNNDLESFGYSISHDLRAPVRAVSGFSQMLEEEYGPSFDERGHHLLSTVKSEASRMNELIDDLLEFSRLGRREIRSANVDMNGLVSRVLEDQAARGEANGRLRVEVTPLPDAFGDLSLLRQVWQNLIANAIKFSSTREDPLLSITGERDGDEAIFHVRDNGVGFDMKYASRLFGVFQRLHRHEEFPGTGVGLAIVRRVISRHGGRVWANAQPGKGATFSFTLPAAGRDL
jgi:signal transduction histidine kinase